MNETKSFPRFRSARRLVQWMERNRYDLGDEVRLPPESERCFFRTKKETPAEVAACVAHYAGWVGSLEPEFEALLVHCNDSVAQYIRVVHMDEGEWGKGLLGLLAGDSCNLYRVSGVIGRLPEEIERTITEPRFAFLYAKEVLRGRLPLDMEHVFFGDEYFCGRYAFEVIRGFAPCRLPDALHTFMVMKSFEEPDNENVRIYIEAAESDPNRVGNSVEEVS